MARFVPRVRSISTSRRQTSRPLQPELDSRISLSQRFRGSIDPPCSRTLVQAKAIPDPLYVAISIFLSHVKRVPQASLPVNLRPRISSNSKSSTTASEPSTSLRPCSLSELVRSVPPTALSRADEIHPRSGLPEPSISSGFSEEDWMSFLKEKILPEGSTLQ